MVELHPEQQPENLQPGQPGFQQDNPVEFAKQVAALYAEAYGVPVPPVPLMTAMAIHQRRELYDKTASLDWWRLYFELCFEDLYLTDRESLAAPLGRKAAGFANLISEKTIATMVERSNREVAHA